MITYFEKRHNSLPYRILSAFIAFTFIFSLVLPPGYAQLIPQTLLNLPAPGAMVPLTNGFTPTLMTGITIHPENPLQFDFIVNTGDSKLAGQELTKEANKLIKYFLASLTVPEDEMWVNLSPYEKDRIIPTGFGTTEMGRDLLAQDYILKQLTASLMYPEKELGKEFWDKIYRKAREQYGTTEIPVNTFNKVWIVPQQAVVYEHGNSAFVVKSHLKVMLEEDYVAANPNVGAPLVGAHDKAGTSPTPTGNNLSISTQIIREVILPAIEKEVNEGKGFANLRQIYNSAILAAWFKQNLRQTLLGQVYVDKTKTKGIDVDDKTVNEKIYAQYLEAFKKGVYNYIKEDYDPATKEVIPRKYFSGGTNLKVGDLVETYKNGQPLTRPQQEILGEYLAGLKAYNSGQVRVNLVELSEKTSVADAQKAIAFSQRATKKFSSPVDIGGETAREMLKTVEGEYPVSNFIHTPAGDIRKGVLVWVRDPRNPVRIDFDEKRLPELDKFPPYRDAKRVADALNLDVVVGQMTWGGGAMEAPYYGTIALAPKIGLIRKIIGDEQSLLEETRKQVREFLLDQTNRAGEKNNKPSSSPVEVEKVKEDVLARIKEVKGLLEALQDNFVEGTVPPAQIRVYSSLFNALRASTEEGVKKGIGEGVIPSARLFNVVAEKYLSYRAQGMLDILNKNKVVSEADKQVLKEKLEGLQASLGEFKALEDVIFQAADLDEQLRKVSLAFNLPEVNVFYAIRNAVDKEELSRGLAGISGMTPEDVLSHRMVRANMIYNRGGKYILRPYFLISSRLKKFSSGISPGFLEQMEEIILDSVDANNFIAGLAWDSRKSEEEIVEFLEGQRLLLPLAGRWRSFYAHERDDEAMRETVEKAENIAGEFIKSHPGDGEFVLAARIAPDGKHAVVTTAAQTPADGNEHGSRILLLDLPEGAEGVTVLHDEEKGDYNSSFGRIAFFDEGKAVAVWNFSRQLKWDISDPENAKPVGWQEEETWAVAEISVLPKKPAQTRGLVPAAAGRSSSPVAGEIKELSPSSTREEIAIVRGLIREAVTAQKFTGTSEAVVLAGTLKYEGKGMRFEDGFFVSFNRELVLKYQTPLAGSAQSTEIFEVNGNPPVHFTIDTIYLEIPGDGGRLLKLAKDDKADSDKGFQARYMSREEFEMAKAFSIPRDLGNVGRLAEEINRQARGFGINGDVVQEKDGSLSIVDPQGLFSRPFNRTLTFHLGFWKKDSRNPAVQKAAADLLEKMRIEASGVKAQGEQGGTASSPVSFKGISPKAGEKLFDMMPLTDEERSIIEVVTIEKGRGVLHERQAFVVLLGGRQLKVYLRPKTIRAMEDAVKAGNSIENTIGEEFDRLDNETTDIKVVLDEVRMAGEGVDVSSSPMPGDTFTKGGIDLNPALLDLQIKRDGNGVPLPLPQQPIENMHIDGFLPIIINVTPITNLPLLLGIADDGLPTNSVDSGSQPMELGFAIKEN